MVPLEVFKVDKEVFLANNTTETTVISMTTETIEMVHPSNILPPLEEDHLHLK